MNGYLKQRQSITPGNETFIESTNPENPYAVVFEDDTDTAYFYAIEYETEDQQRVLDALHIYEKERYPGNGTSCELCIVWSRDWLKCALVIDNICHAVYDFEHQGGYSLNEFPEPNDFWTKEGRQLNTNIIESIFK